jgi:hypothetical protein
MKNILVITAAAAVAFACRPGGGESRAVETAQADEGRPAQLIFPEAVRAEALLGAAGVPFTTRNDLIREFPEGCVWQAAYGTAGPEVILEAYAFTDAKAAATYGAARSRELAAMDVLREWATATNGALLLVAYYDPTADGEAKRETMAKFVSAFAGEE